MIKNRSLKLVRSGVSDIEMEMAFERVLEEYLNRNGRAIFFRLFMVAYYENSIEECFTPVDLMMLDLSLDDRSRSVILEFFSTEEKVEALNWLFWYVFEDGVQYGISPIEDFRSTRDPFLKAISVLVNSIQDDINAQNDLKRKP